jgi:hypothetical protein
MKNQHTPGPWAVTFGKYDASIHTDVTISRISDEAHAWKANANLIAGAPDLLSALEWALGQIEDDLCPDHQAALDGCRAAIAKAKGEA